MKRDCVDDSRDPKRRKLSDADYHSLLKLEKNGEVDQVLEDCKNFPDSFRLRRIKGRTHYEMGQFHQSLREFELSLESPDVDDTKLVRVYHYLALCYESMNAPEKELEFYKKALQVASENEWNFCCESLFFFYMDQESYGLARYYWEQLMKIDDDFWDVLNCVEEDFENLYGSDPQNVISLLASHLERELGKQTGEEATSMYLKCERFIKAQSCFKEQCDLADAIMQNVVESFSMNNDVFVNWSNLTEIHQVWVAFKWPNIVAFLRLISQNSLHVLKTSGHPFSDANVEDIHSFLSNF